MPLATHDQEGVELGPGASEEVVAASGSGGHSLSRCSSDFSRELSSACRWRRSSMSRSMDRSSVWRSATSAVRAMDGAGIKERKRRGQQSTQKKDRELRSLTVQKTGSFKLRNLHARAEIWRVSRDQVRETDNGLVRDLPPWARDGPASRRSPPVSISHNHLLL